MKHISILALLCFAMLFTACEKELDLNPAQSLSTSEALSDVEALKTALNGAYDGLQTTNYYGREFLVIPEIEANLVYLSISNSNRFIDNYTYNWTVANGDHTGLWNEAYAANLRANNVINNVDNVEGDPAELNQIKGEALAIRALIHFDLLRFFAKPYTNGNPSTDLGVPIIAEAGIGEPARNTVEEVYSQIISDLTAAKGLLRNEGKFRFSPEAAEALLARVYLYKGDWANAETAATNIIGNTSYALADDVVDMFAGVGSSEEIFTLKFETSESRGADNCGYIYIPAGYGDIRVSSDLIDLYEPGDSRANFIYEHTNGEYYHSKFQGQDGDLGLYSPKILRLAEMYLIRAEARWRQDATDQGAVDDLNAIRTKRGATAITNINNIRNILDERHRELAFEGHTTFDYWRTGTDMVRQQCSTGLEVNAVCEVAADDFRTVHPIPQAEMLVNQNMVQNPGY